MPRLFVALEIPHNAAMAMSMLRGGLPGARWIDVENYHLTLRFIGDIERHAADEVVEALDGVRQPAFELAFSGIGAFGGKKPRTVFAVPETSQALNELQADIERKCKRMGLRPDPRKFTPHVTLARLRNTSPAAVANYIGARGGFFAPSFKVARFVLMSSRNSTGGGPYIIEEVYPLSDMPAYPSLSSNASHAEEMVR